MSTPQPAAVDQARQLLGLSRLLQLEGDLRAADRPEAVDFIAVNDVARVVPFDHAVLWRAWSRKVTAISGGLTLDRTAPQIRWFEALFRQGTLQRAGEVSDILADALPQTLKSDFAKHIPKYALHVPFTGPRGRSYGALAVLRSEPFSEGELRILKRAGSAIGQAIAAMEGPGLGIRMGALPAFGLTALVVVAAGLVPVPLTVLAEARVAPIDPVIVSAPFDGVIREVMVEPNDQVPQGRPLVRLDTTELAAEHDTAGKRVAVLTADWQRLEQKSFGDEKARAEVSLARAKLAEGEANLAYAAERLRESEIKAGGAGVALIEDRAQWLGRPVRVGERILSLANPQRVRLEIEVPVEDALAIEPGAEVEFFLAIAPAAPVRATLEKLSYKAHVTHTQTAVFQGYAQFTEEGALPRLGLTGTAKVYGARVSLAYALLRRPLAYLRRLTGF